MINGQAEETELCETAHSLTRTARLDAPDRSIDRAARLFHALGDGARLRLLIRLMQGECCVGDLAAEEQEGLSTISQRLRVLKAENIVVKRRHGKHVNYRLADDHIASLVRNALGHVGEPGDHK